MQQTSCFMLCNTDLEEKWQQKCLITALGPAVVNTTSMSNEGLVVVVAVMMPMQNTRNRNHPILGYTAVLGCSHLCPE